MSYVGFTRPGIYQGSKIDAGRTYVSKMNQRRRTTFCSCHGRSVFTDTCSWNRIQVELVWWRTFYMVSELSSIGLYLRRTPETNRNGRVDNPISAGSHQVESRAVCFGTLSRRVYMFGCRCPTSYTAPQALMALASYTTHMWHIVVSTRSHESVL